MKPFKHQVIRQLLLSGKSVEEAAAEAMSTIGYANLVRREMIAGLSNARKKTATKKAVKKRAAPQKPAQKLKPMGLVEMTVIAERPLPGTNVEVKRHSVWRKFLSMLGGK